MTDHSKKDTASAEFKKVQRQVDGKKAVLGYEAEALAVRAKTERLRALRLARDAAQPSVSSETAAGKKRTAKQQKGRAEKLAEWLDDREKSGRNN